MGLNTRFWYFILNNIYFAILLTLGITIYNHYYDLGYHELSSVFLVLFIGLFFIGFIVTNDNILEF